MTSFNNITISLPVDPRRVGWEPPQKSGLAHFKTVAFDYEIMTQLIYFNLVICSIDFGNWIVGVVPEVYRNKVCQIIDDTFNRSFRNLIYKGDETLFEFINELRIEIWGLLTPVLPESDNQ